MEIQQKFKVKKMLDDPNDPRFVDLIQKEIGTVQYGYAILGIPFDEAVSGRKGACRGPKAIRECFPFYSVYDWDRDFELNVPIVDLGDLTLSHKSIETAHSQITSAMKNILTIGLHPILIGGDHSITYAAITAIKNSEHIGVINFDAHLDVRETYDQITSGTPFRRLIDDEVIHPKNLVEIGLQNFKNAKLYRKFAKEMEVSLVSLNQIRIQGVQMTVNAVLKRLIPNVEGIWISIDIDCVDQGFSPGVSNPSSYGMTPWELVDMIRLLALHPKIMGMDLVEMSPRHDFQGTTANLAAFVILNFIASHEFGKYTRNATNAQNNLK